MRDGLEAVQALRGTDRGAVTLVVVGTLASTTLTERLRRFRDAHPAIDLRLRTALSREVSDLVRRGDATLGLRYDADPNPEIVSTTIHDEPMVPVCSPRHRLARVPRVGATALAGERWVAFPPRPRPGGEPYARPSTVASRSWDSTDRRSFPSTASPRKSGWSRPASGWPCCRRAAWTRTPGRHAARAPRPRPPHDGAGRADPSPARLSLRRRAGADGDADRLAGVDPDRGRTSSPSARIGVAPSATTRVRP